MATILVEGLTAQVISGGNYYLADMNDPCRISIYKADKNFQPVSERLYTATGIPTKKNLIRNVKRFLKSA